MGGRRYKDTIDIEGACRKSQDPIAGLQEIGL